MLFHSSQCHSVTKVTQVFEQACSVTNLLFTPSLPIFSHGYIHKICDILQLRQVVEQACSVTNLLIGENLVGVSKDMDITCHRSTLVTSLLFH